MLISIGMERPSQDSKQGLAGFHIFVLIKRWGGGGGGGGGISLPCMNLSLGKRLPLTERIKELLLEEAYFAS